MAATKPFSAVGLATLAKIANFTVTGLIIIGSGLTYDIWQGKIDLTSYACSQWRPHKSCSEADTGIRGVSHVLGNQHAPFDDGADEQQTQESVNMSPAELAMSVQCRLTAPDTCVPLNTMVYLLQVSELSHKLGTAEGNCKSLEEELARLQAQNVQLSKARSEREVDATESRAKLHAAEEKVCLWWMNGRLAVWLRSTMHAHAVTPYGLA